MPAATATRTNRRARQLAWITGPLTPPALYLWAYDPVPWVPPHLAFALYHILLLVTLSAAVMVAMARMQIGVAQAFAAGYNTALAVVEANDDGDDDGDGHRRVHPMPLSLVK